MPAPAHPRQPDRPPIATPWFASAAGQAVLQSESQVVQQAVAERPGQPWLLLAAAIPPPMGGQGLGLHLAGPGFDGAVRCALPLPIASEAVGTVVLQHMGDVGPEPATLLAECVRVLVPGGRLWLLGLNPLAPYRWRWAGQGPGAWEPVSWRRRLRQVGLAPEAITQGVGPRWRMAASPALQDGAGLRAAFLLRAEKRMTPLTPTRARPSLRLQTGVPAA
jgi:SAM-dependent methyltransferase